VSEVPQIYADFQNADLLGRVRLNCVGTVHDLSRQQVQLREGLGLLLYSDDMVEAEAIIRFVVEATAIFSQVEQCWVGMVDWTQIRSEPAIASNRASVDSDDSAI
jgi:hypothetical protein